MLIVEGWGWWEIDDLQSWTYARPDGMVKAALQDGAAT